MTSVDLPSVYGQTSFKTLPTRPSLRVISSSRLTVQTPSLDERISLCFFFPGVSLHLHRSVKPCTCSTFIDSTILHRETATDMFCHPPGCERRLPPATATSDHNQRRTTAASYRAVFPKPIRGLIRWPSTLTSNAVSTRIPRRSAPVSASTT